MTIDRATIFQLFKYAVYLLLSINIYVFFAEEYLAAKVQFPSGVPVTALIEAYAATIDTAAWVVLLLMFELETYVLDDRLITRWVRWSLHSLRALCFSFIVYAFYGYVVKVFFLNDIAVFTGLEDLCTLAPGLWSYAIDLDEYETVTAANCQLLSQSNAFFQFTAMQAVVDQSGLWNLRALAWVDVINSGVWILVVLILEVDVRLQARDLYEGLALRLSNGVKVILYFLLLLAAIYWGLKGDFVDFWDAFLWLVAFVFIELNIFEWRKEDELAATEVLA